MSVGCHPVPGIFPDIFYPYEISGAITEKASKETGLETGIQVSYGGGDQVMQAIGNGIINTNTASITIGTGGQILMPIDKPIYDKKNMASHTFNFLFPNTWYYLGAALSSGLALKWARNNFCNADETFKDILMSIDLQTEDINLALYELVKDKIKPSEYSSKMKKVYADRLFESPRTTLETSFNDGEVDLKSIISNWELFKNKDLSYCLLNDKNNANHITNEDLKKFMSDYGLLASLVVEHNDIYTFINKLSDLSSNEEKHNYLKLFTDDILSKTYKQYNNRKGELIELTNEQYKEIFKYSSLEEYLNKFFDSYVVNNILRELKTLPQDYIFDMPIPVSELLNNGATLAFSGTCGLKNIVDFDNGCGHFFTKNNCEMLKLMVKIVDEYRSIISNEYIIDENGDYIVRPYTKDEFYEVMRRLIMFNKAPDYRDMTGEFRVRNAELFISEQAPEELQKLFYTKSITPQLLLEHPEYIQYLNEKDLSSCFKNINVNVSNEYWENFYKFLGNKTDFNGLMNFITEYGDIFNIVFDINYDRKIIFSKDDVEEMTIKLVSALGLSDGNFAREVSINSPLGKAIFGKSVGDNSSYKVNNNVINVFIKQKLELEQGLSR